MNFRSASSVSYFHATLPPCRRIVRGAAQHLPARSATAAVDLKAACAILPASVPYAVRKRVYRICRAADSIDARLRHGTSFAQKSRIVFSTASSEQETGVHMHGRRRPHFRVLARFCRESGSSYERLHGALDQVQQTGYGIVMPSARGAVARGTGDRPAGRAVRCASAGLCAVHPSAERASIRAEVNPIVGSEKQSEELVHYLLSEFAERAGEDLGDQHLRQSRSASWCGRS